MRRLIERRSFLKSAVLSSALIAARRRAQAQYAAGVAFPPTKASSGPPPSGTIVAFSASTIVLSGALAGVSNSPFGMCSFWFRNVSVTQNVILSHVSTLSGAFSAGLTLAGGLLYAGFLAQDNSGGGSPATLNANSADMSGNGTMNGTVANHVLIAWDTNHPLGSRVAQITINGTSMATTQGGQHGAFSTNYASNVTSWDFMGVETPSPNRFFGDLYDFWFAPGQYMDISVPANIAKFINGSGHPVNLGVDGSFPTGVAPAIFFHKDCSDATAADFAVNQGTGGAVVLTGSPLTTVPPCPLTAGV